MNREKNKMYPKSSRIHFKFDFDVHIGSEERFQERQFLEPFPYVFIIYDFSVFVNLRLFSFIQDICKNVLIYFDN